jgi:hypothetical protein
LLAGIGGMAVAVAIYLIVNAGRPSAHGWGIAMSTDTAFALGLLALVGPRFPDRLRAFMLTVVVVDDILALGVIATVYTDDVTISALLIAVGLFGAVLLARAIGVRRGFVYLALGSAMWVALLESGVEPVVVGLAMGLLAYAYPVARSDLERATERFRSSGSSQRRSSPVRSELGSGPQSRRTSGCSCFFTRGRATDRAGVRARERGHRDRRRLPRASFHLADHARDLPGYVAGKPVGIVGTRGLRT